MRLNLVLAFLCLTSACTPKEVGCHQNADCASGLCRPDGSCAVLDAGSGGGTGGTGGGSGGGGAAGGSGGADGGMGGAGGGGNIGPTCSPNNDGTITRAEMPLGPGLHATFRVATNATFNTAGSPADGGVGTFWDLTVALSGDKSVLVETQPLAGKWFELKYAGASYASPISDTLLGVFEVAPDGLLLRAVVSPTDSMTATELKYDPPAKLLTFPLSSSSVWTTTSTVSGRLNGVAWTQTEKYDSSVDKQGEVLTPFARFPVQRVKTVLTRTVGFVPTVTRSYLFVTECFGTIATINSQAGESSNEFSSAAEVKRLSP